MNERGFDLLTDEEVAPLLRQRIKDGWLILSGPLRLIAQIEWLVYTPGTEKNALFELLAHPSLPRYGIFLAKKVDGLRKCLSNPDDFDRTIAVNIIGEDAEGKIRAVQIVYKEGKLDEAIQQLIARLTEENKEGQQK